MLRLLQIASLVVMLAALGAVAALTAPRWLPNDTARSLFEAEASEALSASVTVDGAFAWEVLPHPRIRAEAVRILVANADNRGHDLAIVARQLVISTGWADIARRLSTDEPVVMDAGSDTAALDGPNLPGWSRQALDFGPLRSLDGDIKMDVTSVRWQGEGVASGSVQIALRNGVVRLDWPDGKGLGGRFSLGLTGELQAKPPAFKVTLSLSNVDASRLAVLAGESRAAASGRLDLETRQQFSGRSEAAWVASASGPVSARFEDGSLRGIDLGALLRAAASGRSGMSVGETDIGQGELEGTVRRGTLQIRKANFSVVPLHVEAVGEVAIAARTYDLELQPRIDPTLGTLSIPISVLVPVEVTGPWHTPRFRPKLERLPTQPLRIACDVLGRLGEEADEACAGLAKGADAAVDSLATGVEKTGSALESGAKAGAKAIGEGARTIGEGAKTIGEGVGKGLKCLGSLFSDTKC